MEIRSSVFQQYVQQEMFFLAGAIGRFRPCAEDNRLGKGLMKSLARKVNPEKAIKQKDQGALRNEEA